MAYGRETVVVRAVAEATYLQVLAGDADIGDRLPIPVDTMQLFDETRGGKSGAMSAKPMTNPRIV